MYMRKHVYCCTNSRHLAYPIGQVNVRVAKEKWVFWREELTPRQRLRQLHQLWQWLLLAVMNQLAAQGSLQSLCEVLTWKIPSEAWHPQPIRAVTTVPFLHVLLVRRLYQIEVTHLFHASNLIVFLLMTLVCCVTCHQAMPLIYAINSCCWS